MYKCYVCTCGFVIHPKMDAFFHHRSRRSCRFFLINRKVEKTAPPLFNRRKFVENWREEGKRDQFGSDLVAKLVALIKIYWRWTRKIVFEDIYLLESIYSFLSLCFNILILYLSIYWYRKLSSSIGDLLVIFFKKGSKIEK